MRRFFSEDRSTIFMNATLVATIAKNKREELRISVLRNNKIDVRMYFYFTGESQPRPTKKGLWLSFKHIPPIIAAFEKFAKSPAAEFKLEFDIPDKDKEKIRVYINDYLGGKVVHIRTFFLKDNEFQPGKGISFSTTLLPRVLESFKELGKHKDPKTA